jgi:uncharacterized protein YejL (UPF0352 family)
MCIFENLALDIVVSTLDYEHRIIFETILQKHKRDTTQLSYLTVDEMNAHTNLHNRTIMKILNDLTGNKFIETFFTTVNKKRMPVYGVNYKNFFNNAYSRLIAVKEKISAKYDLYCSTCNRFFGVSDCINDTFLTQCPNDKDHELVNANKEENIMRQKKAIINDLIMRIKSLQSHEPERKFQEVYRKRPLSESSGCLVASKKSSISRIKH